MSFGGHCETQLATCRRTCPKKKCSLSDWHCWVLLFLVLLAWTVREVIGGFLRGRSRLAEDRAYREAAVACACRPKRKRRLGSTCILGSRVLLWYEGDTVWHERMLLAATCEDQSE